MHTPAPAPAPVPPPPIGKLNVVSREFQEQSRLNLEAMVEKDPILKEDKIQIERDIAEEKARRDAEYASKES